MLLVAAPFQTAGPNFKAFRMIIPCSNALHSSQYGTIGSVLRPKPVDEAAAVRWTAPNTPGAHACRPEPYLGVLSARAHYLLELATRAG